MLTFLRIPYLKEVFILLCALSLGFSSYANDECVDAISLTPSSSCASVVGTFNGSTFGGNAISCATTASQDVWFKFVATDSTTRITIAQQAGLNHGFELWADACGGTLLACVNAGAANVQETYVNTNFEPGRTYYVRAFNVAATVSTATFNICVITYPQPSNDACINAETLQPSTTPVPTVGDFTGALFNGNLVGCATTASQDVWYKFVATDSTNQISLAAQSGANYGFEIFEDVCNGNILACVNAGANNVAETYFNSTFGIGRTYYIRVFNVSATLITSTFSISVTSFPKPSNDECAGAQVLIPNEACRNTVGTFSGAMFNGGPIACAPAAAQDVWFKFVATDSMMEVSLAAQTGLNHGFELREGSCTNAIMDCANRTTAAESYYQANFIPGNTYYIRVFTTTAVLTTSNFSICVRKFTKPTNDACVEAMTLNPGNSCNFITGSFMGAMMNGPSVSCGVDASQDVWYKFVATDSIMQISVKSVTGLNLGFEVRENSCTASVMNCTNRVGANATEVFYSSYFVPGLTYYVRVFNTVATLSELNFDICVVGYIKPANDACDDAETLRAYESCRPTLGTFSGAMLNGNSVSCAMSATQDVWYKFVATDSIMQVTLEAQAGLNHGFELILDDCRGAVVTCRNAGAVGAVETYLSNTFIPNRTYYVRVFNVDTTLTSSTFNICIVNFPKPSNDACVEAQEILPQANSCANLTSGTFSGAMFNGNPISCANTASQDVWYKFTATEETNRITLNAASGLNHGFELREDACNGPIITCVNTGGNNSTEEYFDHTFEIGKTYYIRVFNFAQTINSLSFTLCVRSYPAPTNDDCLGAQEIIPNLSTAASDMGTFSGATLDGSRVGCATSSVQDVWFRFTATDSMMSIHLHATSAVNHGFELRADNCNSAAIACVNAVGASYAENYHVNTFVPGRVYFIRVFSVTGISVANFNISVVKYPKPENDACATAEEIVPGVSCINTVGDFTGAMYNGDNIDCGAAALQDIWYKFTAGANTMTITSAARSGLNQGFVVYEGSCTSAPIACINAAAANRQETSTLNNLTIGQTYYIRVFHVNTAFYQGPVSICVVGSCLPSVRIETPSSIICDNSPKEFTAIPVNGGTNPTYQWLVDGMSVGTNSSTFSSNLLSSGSVVSCIITSNASCSNGITATSNSITMTSGTAAPATFTPVAPICQGQSFVLPTTSLEGVIGTWSPAINNQATTTYTFTPNAGQCATPTTMTVTVYTNAITPTFTAVPSICQGQNFSLPTTSIEGVTGTWSPAINNQVTTTYTFTPSSGQCATSTTMTVTVNSGSVSPTFAPIAPICQGGMLVLPTTSLEGVSGTWSPAINNQVTTTYTFTPSANQCASSLVTMTVVVNPSSAPTFTPITPICQGQYFTLPMTSLEGVSGTWSPAINNQVTTTYTFTPNAGQCAATTTMTVMVTNGNAPTFTPIAPICQGEYFALPIMSLEGVRGTWSPAPNTQMTTTYTFTPIQGQCASSTTMTVVVNPSTVPTFAPIAPICQGTNFTLPTISLEGIVGTWSPAVNSQYTMTYTFTPIQGQCASTTTMTVQVTPAPMPQFAPVAPVCQGSNFTLPTTSLDGVSGTWSPAFNNQFSMTYTFTPNIGQCASTTTMNVQVTPANTPLFAPINPICQGQNVVLPTMSLNGIVGTWSPAINTQATTTYTFTPSANQCASPATMTIQVNPATTPIFAPITPICQGETFILPTMALNGVVGTWSPAINTQATTTYTFTPIAGQCANSTTMTVEVTPATMPVFTPIAPICQGQSFVLPTSSINGVVGTWSPAINNRATTTYTFTPIQGQCASTTTMTVEVTPAPVPTFVAMPSVCRGESFVLPTTSLEGIIGTWSPAINTQSTTTYTFTPSAGQCAAITTMTVEVMPMITPIMNQVAPICEGQNFTLPTTSLNGIVGTWSPVINTQVTTTYTFTPDAGQCASTTTMTVIVNPNVSASFMPVAPVCQGNGFFLPSVSLEGYMGTWSPAINTQATTTYTFTPMTNQCVAPSMMTVVVNPTVTPIVNQVAPICQGDNLTLPTTSLNGITGVWTPAINNQVTTTYRFIPAQGQCAVQTTMTVIVNPGTIPTFTPITPVCQGANIVLPTTSLEGIVGTWSPAVNNQVTTTYTFTPNAGQCALSTTMTIEVMPTIMPIFNQVAPICEGQNFTLPTTSINGILGTWSPAVNNQVTTTYTFTPNAGQCASSITMTVYVNPSAAPTFTAIAPVCEGNAFFLPSTSLEGVMGTWSPAINTQTTTTYTFTPIAGQCYTTTTMTVVVTPMVTPILNQVAPICAGDNLVLPTTSLNGITGAWTPAVNNQVTTTYRFIPAAGQCATQATMTVFVNPTIVPTFNQVPAICIGDNFTLPTTSLEGITGTWSPAMNTQATTTYTFTPNASQCASIVSMTVVVNPSTTPLFNQVAPVCAGQNFTLPTTSINGIVGTWSPAINNQTTTNYTFTPANACALPVTMTVVVNNEVMPTFAQVAPVCQGANIVLPTISLEGITGTWTPATNNQATTTYTFVPTAGQCAITTVMTVMVNTPMVPQFVQVAPVCQGANIVLPTTSLEGIVGTWSPAVNNQVTTTYTFTPNAGQCAISTAMTVEVTTGPTPTFTPIATLCQGGNNSFTLPTTSLEGIVGTWSPAIDSLNTTTYMFTPNAGQCASTTTMTVAVTIAEVPTFAAIPMACDGAPYVLPTTSLEGFTGTWSPAVDALNTTTYTFTPDAGQCATITRLTVTAGNSITPTFNPIAPVCNGHSFTLSTMSIEGIVGTWASTADRGIYRFTPNAGQCAVSTTMEVIVYDPVNVQVDITNGTIVALAQNATYQWMDCATNSIVVGETSSTFTPNVRGQYAVIVTQNGCVDTSDCVNVYPVSVEEAMEETTIQVMPNPFQTDFTLVTHHSDLGAMVTITDVTGRVIIRQQLHEERQVFNLQEFAAGMYFINITTRPTAVKVIKL